MHWNTFTMKFWNMKKFTEIKEIYISGFAYILAAAALLLLPLRWMFSFLLCAAIHEAAHILCAVCLGVKIVKIQITAFGAGIYTQPMNGLQEFLCAMAGPAVGLLPLFAYRVLPEAALICLLLSTYNLLPIYPADGARMLQCVLQSVLPYGNAGIVMRIVEACTAVACCVLCLWAAVLFRSSLPVLVAVIWLPLRIKMEIQLAKQEKKKYNNLIKTSEV